MIEFSHFHFIRPAWLVLIPVALALWSVRRAAGDPLRGWRGIMQPELLDALTVGQGNRSQRLSRETTVLVAWLLAVIAVAGPTWKPEPSPFVDEPLPVMVVLKASESMNQTDLMPTRMERARLKVADFGRRRTAQPLGLIAYAGSPHLVLPPTRDTTVVAGMAAEIGPEIMPKPGDDLAAALTLADNTLGAGRGVVLVFADTVAENSSTIADFREQCKRPVFILAIARSDSPEWDALNEAARSLDAAISLITSDSSDIDRLVRQTTSASGSLATLEDGARWEEAGWWLVPVLAAIVLGTFRREIGSSPQEQA
ncbi:VWA domain-containing protein [Stieleria sp. ICT_E10.1]|uniref:VWA domain-containing protein n=1 Tax=Stieleria sedimenti TaxID=2976331 RepID=UPI00217F893F|nr:VWA domain-containing protein [Stieleria sedimenti]MCS7467361.1 VWA domain-containing protein [Stieleria sedimenti]